MTAEEIDMDAPMGGAPAEAPSFDDDVKAEEIAGVEEKVADLTEAVRAEEAKVVEPEPETEKPKTRGRKQVAEQPDEAESVPQPTIGRIVHYYTDPAVAQRAAIIVAIYSDGLDTVSLCVLNTKGIHVLEEVPFSPEPQAGHWSWPPRQ